MMFRALSDFVHQMSPEHKIGMSSICEIPGIAAYSVQIPDVPIPFSIHGTGQCPPSPSGVGTLIVTSLKDRM
jgi:hypothetical protein